jgi:hypothetical protein
MFRAEKRDTHAIWFRHLPEPLAGPLAALQPNGTVSLLINGSLTTWARMRSSSAGTTPGIKITGGRPTWERITRGETFTLTLGDGAASPPTNTGVAQPVVPRLATAPHQQPAGATPLFDGYEFADFSGAKDKAVQRRAIRMAVARGGAEPQDVGRSLTRESLQQETVERLEAATRNGVRLAFGRDHQYSIPVALGAEIGMAGKGWRDALDALVRGTYGGPPLTHASEFARAFNEWSVSRGRRAYFFSCTKGREYGITTTDPRPSAFGAVEPSTYRLTELNQGLKRGSIPKPLNRLGDNGTVGGQTLVGLVLLHELLAVCGQAGVALAVWPFDGIDVLSAPYEGRHVMFEPYPSAVRAEGVEQTDWNDAVASVLCVQRADRAGKLPQLLDLGPLPTPDRRRVLFEGWIVGHQPRGAVGA